MSHVASKIPTTYADWQAMAAGLAFESRAFIDDAFAEAVHHACWRETNAT